MPDAQHTAGHGRDWQCSFLSLCNKVSQYRHWSGWLALQARHAQLLKHPTLHVSKLKNLLWVIIPVIQISHDSKSNHVWDRHHLCCYLSKIFPANTVRYLLLIKIGKRNLLSYQYRDRSIVRLRYFILFVCFLLWVNCIQEKTSINTY